MTKWKLWLVPAVAVVLAWTATGCNQQSGSVPEGDSSGLVRVKVIRPQRVTLQKTTTQPATAHAYYEARINAKVSGYVKEIKTDIGQVVKEKGTPLAVLDVPELEKRKEKLQATELRLKAEEVRAEADIRVAEAVLKASKSEVAKAEAEVNSATSDLTAAQAEFVRMEGLVRERAVADKLLDEARKRQDSAVAAQEAAQAAVSSAKADQEVAEARVEVAQAELKTAKTRTQEALKDREEVDTLMSFATITSPFPGVVWQRNVELGDLVQPARSTSGKDSHPLFVIIQLKPLRVCVHVPERDAPWVREGVPAKVTFPALSATPFEGKVARAAGGIDPSTRTRLVEIDLKNEDGKLLPGMFGQATLILDDRSSALVLPAEAVRYTEKGDSYVFVADEQGTVQEIKVKTGLDDGKQIEIVEGLTGAEAVIGPTVKRLRSGQKVTVEKK